MPTPKQMEKMAALVGGKASPAHGLAPSDDLPREYWESLLRDAGADETVNRGEAVPGTRLQLNQIAEHVLRVACSRCGRTVEIQRLDAVRLYGPNAVWKVVGQRLLDNTCQQRTGRHEEDGCWPQFE